MWLLSVWSLVCDKCCAAGCDQNSDVLVSRILSLQAEAPAGGEANLIDVGFTDDVTKGGHGGGGGGGFTAPLIGHDALVPLPAMMPMPMPAPNPPFSYPPPKGPVSAFTWNIPFLRKTPSVLLTGSVCT